MPRNYQRKTNRGNTSKEVLEVALVEIEMGLSIRHVAKTHGIDRITLTRYRDKVAKGEFTGTSYAGTSKAKMVFPKEMEEELAKHLTLLSDSFYGLSKDKAVQLTYEYAVKNNLTIPPTWITNKRAG